MSESNSRAIIECDHCEIEIIRHVLKVHTKRHHPVYVVKERIKKQLPVSGFFTLKKVKIDDILPDTEVTSNDESVLQNTTDDEFNLEEKAEEVVVSDNIGLCLGDFKDIMDKNTKKIIDIIDKNTDKIREEIKGNSKTQ